MTQHNSSRRFHAHPAVLRLVGKSNTHSKELEQLANDIEAVSSAGIAEGYTTA